MPKRGFNNIFATEYTVVNVADLEARFENGAVIDTDALIDAGLVTKVLDGVKVLGNGEVTKSFTVKAAKFSESAKAKIESAGGKAEVDVMFQVFRNAWKDPALRKKILFTLLIIVIFRFGAAIFVPFLEPSTIRTDDG